MWLAREKTGELMLFTAKPEYNVNEKHYHWHCKGQDAFLVDYSEETGDNVYENEMELLCDFCDLYPEVTFENSPVELVPKIQRDYV